MCEHKGTGWGKRHDEIFINCKLIILLTDWPTVVLVSGDGWLWTGAPLEQTEMGGMGERNAFIWAGFCTWYIIHPIQIAQVREQKKKKTCRKKHHSKLAFNMKNKENTLKVHVFVLCKYIFFMRGDDTTL